MAILIAIWVMGVQAAGARAQKILPEGIKDLATQIATNVAKEQKQRIAVLPFRELDGKETMLGTYISEELVTNLFMIGGLDIIERTMLDRLIGELKLDRTGLIDPETAKKVGKIAGVNAIVTGSITDFQSYVALNCRLIDAQTGRIFGAAQAKIVKDDDLRKIMNMQRTIATEATTAESDPSTPAGEAERKPSSKAILQQEVEGILFELKGCFLSGESVNCTFFMTSKGGEQKISLAVETSRLVDEEGNEYRARRVTAGAQAENRIRVNVFGESSRLVGASLTRGIPLKGQIAFSGVSPGIRTGKLIELRFIVSREEYSAKFRDVPLARD